jgi:uncharacterized protein DUF4440
MRYLFTIWFLFACLFAVAQTTGSTHAGKKQKHEKVDTVSLKEAMSGLDKALLNKDEDALLKLLHKDLSYGHSSGWSQTKYDIMADFRSGKLIYMKIENSSVVIVAQNKNWATVRTNTSAEGELDHKPFQLKLHVLQVWINTKQGWQLLARQSAKL